MFTRSSIYVLLLVIALLPAAPQAAALNLGFERISDLPRIVDIRHAGDRSGRLFLVEQAGRIWVRSTNGGQETPFLDLRGRVLYGGERGLLSLAFAPDHLRTGLFYTWYTNRDGDMVLSRFSTSPIDPDRADAGSEVVLLTVPQPRANHNGGQLQFGPDGHLYLSVGDGGGAGDPDDEGQDTGSLLGSLLRLEVGEGIAGYRIPPDNPLVGREGRDELWAWGLRNPWRIAFDPLSGDLFIADVGQNDFEEINHQPALASGGRNYGWNLMEGDACFQPGCDQNGLVRPVGGYGHDLGCSVTGGVVYRGEAYPDLHGAYLFADYCSGTIWGLYRDGEGWIQTVLAETDFRVLTFGTGGDGSVYLSAAGEGVFRLADGPARPEPSFSLNAGLNDAWYDPETPGQGVFLIVRPASAFAPARAALAWFTFDLERPVVNGTGALPGTGQRWFTAEGPWKGDWADLALAVTRGGRFDQVPPAPASAPAGTLWLTFTSCARGMLTYRFAPGGPSGQVPLRRVARDNRGLCEALAVVASPTATAVSPRQ